MTVDDFNQQGFTGGMKCVYNGKLYDLVSVDFEEALIGINQTGGEDDISWKRCENIEIVK